MVSETHPLRLNSWLLIVRALQFVFAALVLSLAAYTVSIYPNWAEIRFAIAAVIRCFFWFSE